MRACERCHSRKTKCDRRLPSCTSCTKGRVQCQYPNKWRDRQLRQEYIKSVELRLRELECENARLRGRHAGSENAPPNNGVETITEDEHEVAMVMALSAAGNDHYIPQQPTIPSPSPPGASSPATRPQSMSAIPSPPLPAPDVTPIVEPPPATHHPFVSRLSPTQSTSSYRTSEEAQYLGSSNGVEFTDVVERIIDKTSHDGTVDNIADDVAVNNGTGISNRDTNSSHNGNGWLSFTEDAATKLRTRNIATGTAAHNPQTMASLAVHLPPDTVVDMAVSMPLVEAYFAHWHLTFPLLHRSSFLRMIRDLYDDSRRYGQDPAAAFAFDIVLALGAASPTRIVGWGQGAYNSELYFSRALSRLDTVVALRDIRALQALLLYCKYGIHASLRDTSRELWEILGQATRLVVELGLHQSSSRSTGHTAARTLPKFELHISGLLPAAEQVEMQRRCFWCYYNLQTYVTIPLPAYVLDVPNIQRLSIVNVSLGRPLAIHEDDIDVPLPSMAWDDGRDASSQSTESPSSPPPLAPLSPFVHHTKYRRLQARIHRCMYTSRSVHSRPLGEREAIRDDIYTSLRQWRQDTARLGLHLDDNITEGVKSPFLHPSWYQALYHSACLMLFRPSTAFPATEQIEGQKTNSLHKSPGSEGDDRIAASANRGVADTDDPLHIIWTASRGVLRKYSELLHARHFNYSWVAFYTVFMAGLANVYAVGCCALRRTHRREKMFPTEPDVDDNPSVFHQPRFLPALLDTVGDFRDCSNILIAISERWNDARTPYDTFSRLSMRAIQDLASVACREEWHNHLYSGERDGSSFHGGGPLSVDGVPDGRLSSSTQPQQPLYSFGFTQDTCASSGIITSPGLTTFQGWGADGTFTTEHMLADNYSMVDFQQLFQDI